MSGIINSVGSKSGVISGKNIEARNLVGTISSFGMAAIPTGWLLCDDQAVLRVGIYGALFNAIGTTWGTGDGSTTFNVPDLEGAFLRGAGTSTLFTQDSTTTLAGVQDDNVQNHRHSIWSSISGATGTGSGAVNYAASSPGTFQYYAYSSNVSTADQGTGSGVSPRYGSETRPNNIGVRFYIKF
jgi:microcystin-dependent protein